MFKLIKWLIFLAIIGTGILWYTGTKVKGKTVKEHLAPILESKTIKEGMKDIRSIVGEGLKAAGEAISEDVTDKERKELDNLVKQELEKGSPITGATNQKALSPEKADKRAVEKRPDILKEIEQKMNSQAKPTAK